MTNAVMFAVLMIVFWVCILQILARGMHRVGFWIIAAVLSLGGQMLIYMLGVLHK